MLLETQRCTCLQNYLWIVFTAHIPVTMRPLSPWGSSALKQHHLRLHLRVQPEASSCHNEAGLRQRCSREVSPLTGSCGLADASYQYWSCLTDESCGGGGWLLANGWQMDLSVSRCHLLLVRDICGCQARKTSRYPHILQTTTHRGIYPWQIKRRRWRRRIILYRGNHFPLR